MPHFENRLVLWNVQNIYKWLILKIKYLPVSHSYYWHDIIIFWFLFWEGLGVATHACTTYGTYACVLYKNFPWPVALVTTCKGRLLRLFVFGRGLCVFVSSWYSVLDVFSSSSLVQRLLWRFTVSCLYDMVLTEKFLQFLVPMMEHCLVLFFTSLRGPLSLCSSRGHTGSGWVDDIN